MFTLSTSICYQIRTKSTKILMQLRINLELSTVVLRERILLNWEKLHNVSHSVVDGYAVAVVDQGSQDLYSDVRYTWNTVSVFKCCV